jgi:hypothetical protein
MLVMMIMMMIMMSNNGGMIMNFLENTCLSATSCTSNATWTGLVSKPGSPRCVPVPEPWLGHYDDDDNSVNMQLSCA